MRVVVSSFLSALPDCEAPDWEGSCHGLGLHLALSEETELWSHVAVSCKRNQLWHCAHLDCCFWGSINSTAIRELINRVLFFQCRLHKLFMTNPWHCETIGEGYTRQLFVTDVGEHVLVAKDRTYWKSRSRETLTPYDSEGSLASIRHPSFIWIRRQLNSLAYGKLFTLHTSLKKKE
jgi:hypothetical protein